MVLVIGEPVFDRDVAPFDVTRFGQTSAECLREVRPVVACERAQESHHWHRRLLARAASGHAAAAPPMSVMKSRRLMLTPSGEGRKEDHFSWRLPRRRGRTGSRVTANLVAECISWVLVA